MTIVGYHTKVVTFFRRRKCFFFVGQTMLSSGKCHTLKSPYIVNSQMLEAVHKKIGPVFHKLHIA